MKVKSSNTTTYILLIGLSVLVFLLIVFGNAPVNEAQEKNQNLKEREKSVVLQETALNFIEIFLSEKNYNKLKKYRDRALSVGVISAKDKKYVSAIITFNGKEYKADIRLKGDWTDHLIGDKWSFRIKLKGDKTIQGMKKFSIHHPITRNYLNEWVYHKAYKAEGLIGLRYGFVEGALHIKKEDGSGFVNNNLGIYAIEETFDKRMLENNKRKESVILKFSEENWWNDVKKRIEAGSQSGIKWTKFWSKDERSWKFPTTVFSESKVLEDTLMHNYFKLSKNILEKLRTKELSIEKVFDLKQLALHSALVNLFGSFHGNYIINNRFYYNPITSKLEPISFDGNSGQKITEYHYFRFVKKERDSLFIKELIMALEKVSKKEYLDKLINTNDVDYFEEVLSKEFLYSELKRDYFAHNQEIIKEELTSLKKLYPKVEELTIEDEVSLTSSNYTNWKMTNTSLSPINKKFKNYKVFSFARKDTTSSSYTISKYINVDFNEEYTASFIVRASTKSDLFAIRIQGQYPNRVDAVYDLKNGIVKETKESGDFQKGYTRIKELQDGWYLCSLKTTPKNNSFKVIIGSANSKAETPYWESKSIINNEIYIAL